MKKYNLKFSTRLNEQVISIYVNECFKHFLIFFTKFYPTIAGAEAEVSPDIFSLFFIFLHSFTLHEVILKVSSFTHQTDDPHNNASKSNLRFILLFA
jgi:hypothetical protein